MSARLVALLDSIEQRVEQMRSSVQALEIEKDTLVTLLRDFESSPDFQKISDSEKEELLLIQSRLLKRATTVDVTLLTPRSEHQIEALRVVTDVIDNLLVNFHEEGAKRRCETYLNACLTETTGPVDHKFQSKVIECAADDQKKIRKKLQDLLKQFNEVEASENWKNSVKKQRTRHLDCAAHMNGQAQQTYHNHQR